MPVDESLQPLLALLNAPGVPKLSDGTPEAARLNFRRFTVDARQPESLVPVASVEDVTIDSEGVALPGRVYRPEADGPVPTIVFFHGGGFVIGDIDTHDDQVRWICREVGAVVLSVGYRLAPESQWPGPVDDALTAVEWALSHVASLGGDAARVAVAGDSAGGNLAAVVAQERRDVIAAQLLIYPATDFADVYPSMSENSDGYFLTGADMVWFSANYVPPSAELADPRLSPLRGRLDGLPPAVVVTAEFDPLRDAGDAYAAALEAAGVRTIAHRFDGLIHGFFGLPGISPASEKAVRITCASFRELLA
ncbi:alpha/beta hydrolase [Cryptosporangium aurantiacum]|uniref:Acetyl esterase n=1 Tax=Cryptosporangium aurantiacum TaxID=134849 RepID=A0A1M7QXD5_9ACTN|nr:alpha/beta hydrolase [Cryptosporangium aurantiacum]SHN36721.1 acetyl esterase [Cryptosporangium aurantiacum]